MILTITVATLLALGYQAHSADVRHADQPTLPMNFGLDGSPLWRASRRVAVWFIPALAVFILIPLSLFAPDPTTPAIVALSLLGGQALYHWLIGRSL